MAFNKCECLTEFRAFWKSIWSTPSSDWALTMLACVIFDKWMIASASADSQLQTIKHLNGFWCSLLARHFAMRHRNTSPAGIRRTPPFFLDNAASEAQQSALEIKVGKSPLLSKLTNFIAHRATSGWSGAVQSTACWRCSGNVLEGPAAMCFLNVFSCS